MSWASATQDTPAQRIPAWKRLGLKLKGDASGESPTFPAGSPTSTAGSVSKSANKAASAHRLPNAKVNGTAGAGPGATASGQWNKRKQAPSYADNASKQPGSKRPRVGDTLASEPDRHQPPSELRRQKSVTFADDTKLGATEKSAPSGNQAQQVPRKKKARKAKGSSTGTPTAKPPANIEPSLSYLRQWHVDRSSWKFNKNHQTLLIKCVFDTELLPSSDIATFYAYIRDIKGFVRTRLRETAQEITKQDMEKGAKAFPASVKDADAKQAEYEKLISGLLPGGRQKQQQQQQNGETPASHGRLKRTFDEADFVSRTADLDIRQRALKRIRAEVVLDELSDSDGSSASSATATTTSSSSASADQEEESAADAPGEKRLKLNDGSQRRVVKRRRKLRSAIQDEDSSSDSESDASSSSSRSSSSSEESDDDDGVPVDGIEAQESSSSSSSSSESDSGSDGDTESDDADSEGADERDNDDED